MQELRTRLVAFELAGIVALGGVVGCEASLMRGAGFDSDGRGPGAGEGDGDRAGPDASGRAPQPPKIFLHRLNRFEYDNTVRDLLGVDLHPAEQFPPDPAVAGFDNNAAGLGMTPAQFDLYFAAARELVDAALDEAPRYFQTAALPAGAPEGSPVGDAWALRGADWNWSFDLSEGGEMSLDVSISGTAVGNTPEPQFVLFLDGQVLASGQVTGRPLTPQRENRVLALTAGTHQVRIHPTNFVNEAAMDASNQVIVHRVSVTSTERISAPSRARLLPCDVEQAECLQSSVETFAERAYRRVLDETTRAELAQLRASLAREEDALEVLKLSFRAVLSSPRFLYRSVQRADVVQESGEARTHVGAIALASRLSYFLWSSMPDDELLSAAKEGGIDSTEGLRAQVQRLLADERSQALVTSFSEQWLGTRLLENSAPSTEKFPGFDEELRDAMVGESKGFFQEFLFNDAPLSELTQPNFGILNDRLAAHYGTASPGSSELQRVPLVGDERRGLLSLGAWLTAQSDPESTSPIRRGHWFLDQFYCEHVPAPPAGVVTVLPGDPELPIRDRLELHRSDASCAGCHDLLDPAGLGFEAYDAIGAWRGAEVDSSGELPGGLVFADPKELAQELSGSDVVAACLSQKLMTYGLGREPSQFDDVSLDQLRKSNDLRSMTVKQLLEEIVVSEAFRTLPAPEEFEQTL